jgi:hypothetical protein
METDEDTGKVTKWQSSAPVDVNGVPVFVNYDSSGKPIGYEGDPRTTSWINGKQRIIGSWDANGQPNPQTSTSSGAGIRGFVGDIMSDPVLGAAANIAASYFGGPLGTAALGAVQGLSLEDIVKNAAISYAAGQVINGISADPNAVGGVTGPDNIDVGGGFNPADGFNGAIATPVSLDLPVGTPLPPLPEGTPVNDYAINGTDNLDMGGGFNPAAGYVPTSNPIYDYGNAVSNPVYDYGDAVSNPIYDYGDATPAEITSAKTAMAAKGLSFKDALDYVRAGLFVNAITGDPLGLAGDKSGGGGAVAPTGFEQVPIPSEWKSPTYAASAAPIDLNSIFTDKNLLAGTQWQNLPQQQNVSFNDIFASGQQRTPMGKPVDINQIVSAILGQNATSQKPA